MHKLIKSNKGFTLIEMIVVIAIIAILAAVIIPTTAGFIDRARLARDRISAADMTKILTAHSLESTWDLEDPLAIRQIINRFTEGHYDFVTLSKDAGFFYVPKLNAVRALKFTEAAQLDFALCQESFKSRALRVWQLNEIQAFDDTDMTMPEHLFGADKMLLSTRGTKVADIVHGLRNGFSHEVLVQHNTTHPLQRPHAEQARLTELLAVFHPERTVFVSHGEWRTDALPGDTVEQIIYAPGLSHIPSSMGGSWLFAEHVTQLVLPESVKTIAKDAFTIPAFAGFKIVTSSKALTVHAEALGPEVDLMSTTRFILDETAWQARIINQLESVTIHRALEGEQVIQQVVLEALSPQIRENVTAYHWLTKGRQSILKIFTHEGLYAEIITLLED